MGAVWLASDGLRHRDVALRAVPWVPPPDAGEQETWRERALREARALAQLNHPNIVGILDIFEDDGGAWKVFEAAPYRFPHRPLSDVLRNDGPLRPEQAAQVGRQVLAALRQAHAVGVPHRDIKPGSILLGAGDRVMLADFGMVTADGSPALTTPEAWTGSPFYMAPERARGEPATPAADLWSLGATLYAAVEGRAPFHGDGTVAVLTAVMSGHPDPPRRAGPLWPVISGLLRKDPAARPDAEGVDWLLWRVAGRHSPARLARPAATARPPAGAAAAPGTDTGADQTGPLPAVTALRPPQPADAGNAGAAAEFIPGFRPPDRPPAAPQPPARKARRHWWITAGTGGTVAATAVAAVMVALWPASDGTAGHSLAVVPGHSLWAPGPPPAGPSRQEAAPAAPNASRARRVVPPGPAVPEPVRPVPRAPRGGGAAALPAGFHRYRDPTGFSIGVPDNWQISHQGHLVYIRDSHSGEFLIIDQTSHPKPNPLADWRQQEAARAGTYPGYHRIRLRAVRYAPAKRAADWEFTYYDNGQLTHVLNRNILANAQHAYALYWSTPASVWRSSYHYFLAFARTFRPAPARQRN